MNKSKKNNEKLFGLDDRGWSEWQPFSECKGIPCSIGRQRRIRTCLNPPTITNKPSCDGDHIQERECSVACSKDFSSSWTGSVYYLEYIVYLFVFKDTDFTEWSSWSDCIGNPCQMSNRQRVRTCLKQSACDNEQIQVQDCFVPCLNRTLSSLTSTRTLFNGNDRFRVC